MNRIEGVMVMHSRNRMAWFLHPWFCLAVPVTYALRTLREGLSPGRA